jgi:hypothetical protein
MNTSTSRRIAASTALFLLAAGALADGGPAAAGSRVDVETVAPTGDGQITIDSLASGALVLRLGHVGGYWQPDSPDSVSVYADGRVIVRDEDEQLGYATFLIDRAALEELLAVAAAATPFEPVDYGQVLITDVGSTRVTVHGDQGDAVIEVWALDHLDGLSDEQRSHRERLLALVAAMQSLDASTVEPYTSDEVMVVLRPVLPGMGPLGTPKPWPLAEAPTELSGDPGLHTVCLAVPAASVGALPDEVNGEHLWSLPHDLGVATPHEVAASLTAVLPEQKPCEAFDPVEPARLLAPDELRMPPHDWASPWPQGPRTTTHPFEEWMAVDAMARTVLPAELGGTWDWNRWSWFEYRFAASDVDGRRVIDIEARCTDYVTDEEPACIIDARFDAITGELLEFSAA